MSIQDKLDYLNETKSAIQNAISEQGVEINDSDTFRSYADKILEIEGETIILDDEVTEESSNGVKSSGIYDALETYLGYAVNSSQSIVNSKIQYSSTDLEAGVSELETGVVYLVYEE